MNPMSFNCCRRVFSAEATTVNIAFAHLHILERRRGRWKEKVARRMRKGELLGSGMEDSISSSTISLVRDNVDWSETGRFRGSGGGDASFCDISSGETWLTEVLRGMAAWIGLSDGIFSIRPSWIKASISSIRCAVSSVTERSWSDICINSATRRRCSRRCTILSGSYASCLISMSGGSSRLLISSVSIVQRTSHGCHWISIPWVSSSLFSMWRPPSSSALQSLCLLRL